MAILLIHPPVVRPSELPAGIYRLQTALHRTGISTEVWDANLEGIRYLIDQPPLSTDTWTRRAFEQRQDHLRRTCSWDGYSNYDTYQRLVRDLSRILAKGPQEPGGWITSLVNLEHRSLSPARSSDFVACSEAPETNPFFHFFSSHLENLIRRINPVLIGISLNYLSQAFTTFAMIGFLKKRFPGCKIVVGGGLITSWVSRPEWKNQFEGLIDFLVSGPGEEPLVKIALGMEKESAGMGSLPEKNSITTLPYFSPVQILPVSGSSGCFWRKCKFCPEASESVSFKPYSYDSVLDEISGMKIPGENDALIHFIDNAMSPVFFSNLAARSPGLPWYGFARFERSLLDEEFCRQLRKSGCVMLQLGLESGSQEVLDNLEKNVNLDDASRILGNLKKAGIATYVYLLFGTHFEGKFEAGQTLDYVAQNAAAIDFLNLAIFNLPTSSPEVTSLKTQSFSKGDLNLYSDFIHPKGWDRKKVRKFLDLEFRTHPAILPILKRDPPIFTSNHAPFFTEGFRKRKINKY